MLDDSSYKCYTIRKQNEIAEICTVEKYKNGQMVSTKTESIFQQR